MGDAVVLAIRQSTQLDDAAKEMLTSCYLTLVKMCRQPPALTVVPPR